MNKLHFDTKQELVNFTLSLSTCLPTICINNMIFYTTSCKINTTDKEYIDIYDNEYNLICSINANNIEKINYYTIIKKWE